MAYIYDGWCRIEGTPVPNIKSKYTVLPQGISNVWFVGPEIQIFNENSTAEGVVYKVVPMSEGYAYQNFDDLLNNYSTIRSWVSNSLDKTINLTDDVNSGQGYYTTPFVINKSSVILYASSVKTSYDHYTMVFVDGNIDASMTTIMAEWVGGSVAVGTAFDESKLIVRGIYENGTKVKINQGYTIEPADKIITLANKTNIVTITYIDGEEKSHVCTVGIPGVRRLIGLEANYNGSEAIPYGHAVPRENIVVVAKLANGASSDDYITTTVTDYSFPNGNILSEANHGIIDIYYKSLTASLDLRNIVLTITSSRLVAFWKGGNLEVGTELLIKNAEENYNIDLRIFYAGSSPDQNYSGTNSWDVIQPDDPKVTYSPTLIDHEGINHILVTYQGTLGPVTCDMLVIGVEPEVKLLRIEAKYTGPEVYVGKGFPIERVIVKAYYDNGYITDVKSFSVKPGNLVNQVGINTYEIEYLENSERWYSSIEVTGLEPESTTESGYFPIQIDNHYPELVSKNNRYRGPAESEKQQWVFDGIYNSILKLNDLFKAIENDFETVVEMTNGYTSSKITTLNNNRYINEQINKWKHDKRFASGTYVREDDNE